MATILKDAAYMALPMNIKRGNPIPLDTTAVWYDKTELNKYAASGATAYVGQILTLCADNKCEAYMISNEAGTLIKLASTTASGDLAGDVATLQGQVTNLISKVGKAADGEVAATGLYKEIADVLAVANGKVASVAAADKSITVGGSATKPTVKVAIASGEDNALSLAADGLKVVIPEVTVPEYSMKKLDAATDGMSASYQLTKDGTAIGAVIDIPKDMVVKSGSVQTFAAGELPAGVPEAGTYIVLVLANVTNDKLYIKVDDLIEYVTSGSKASDMVFINIDPKTHQVTATITNGSITEAKLAKAVTDKLALASSAVQEIKAGTDNGTIAVDGKNVAVTGLQSAAYAESSAFDAAGTAAKIKTALEGTDADKADALTIKGAKKYAAAQAATAKTAAETTAKGYVDGLTLADKAVTKQLVSAVTQTNGQIAVIHRELVADDIPELGITKISNLKATLDTLSKKQDQLEFNTNYDAALNKAATMTDVENAKIALVGKDKDTEANTTIKGVQKYADKKASAAETAAKAYADSLVGDSSAIAGRVTTLEGKVDVAKVSTAISTAKNEAIEAAATDAASKDTALKTEILGKGHTGTVKEAYDLANKKTSMAEVEAKGYAVKTEVDTAVAAAKKAGTDAQASVNTLSGKVGTIPVGAKATTVIGYVDEQVKVVKTDLANYAVTCKATTPEGYAKRYTLSQGDNQIVSIDIPSDLVVSSGKVVENPVGQPAGTYIELTLSNATKDKIYINVGDLIEYVTGADAADGIITTSVDANHVLTATINNGTITKAKLIKSVQDSLDKADSALQAAALTPYAKTKDIEATYVAKNGTDKLMTEAESTKLAAIADNAQVNVIEAVKVGGTPLDIADKAVNIEAISTDLLTQGAKTLILNGGTAASL